MYICNFYRDKGKISETHLFLEMEKLHAKKKFLKISSVYQTYL